MAIEFYLNPNNLHQEKEAHKAQLLIRNTLDSDDLIEAMLSRGTGVTRTDMVANEELRDTVLLDQLLEGHPIQTKLFKVRLKIEGVFDGAIDRFDPKRHRVRVVITPSAFLQKQVEGLYPRRKLVSKNTPILSSIWGLGKKSVDALVPGGYFVLRGSHLYLDPADPEQGIFLVDAQRQKTRVEEYAEIRPSSITFCVPAGTAAGAYTLDFAGCTKRRVPHGSVSYGKDLSVSLPSL
jgi:hypothetical protein